MEVEINIVFNIHRNRNAGREEGEKMVWRWGKREIIYLSQHCHHRKDRNCEDLCIKMGSDEGHFNVSLIVKDKDTTLCPQTTTFLKRTESRSGIEPRPFCFRGSSTKNGNIKITQKHKHGTETTT